MHLLTLAVSNCKSWFCIPKIDLPRMAKRYFLSPSLNTFGLPSAWIPDTRQTPCSFCLNSWTSATPSPTKIIIMYQSGTQSINQSDWEEKGRRSLLPTEKIERVQQSDWPQTARVKSTQTVLTSTLKAPWRFFSWEGVKVQLRSKTTIPLRYLLSQQPPPPPPKPPRIVWNSFRFSTVLYVL